MHTHRLPALPWLLGLALASPALAAPSLTARLDAQPLPLHWQALSAQRYATELQLEAGELELRAPTAGGTAETLAPYRRQPAIRQLGVKRPEVQILSARPADRRSRSKPPPRGGFVASGRWSGNRHVS